MSSIDKSILSEPTFIENLNDELRKKSAVERIRRTWEVFDGKVAVTTSFGVNSALMLYLATKAVPEIPIIWVDTGYHFRETYEFAEQLRELLKLNLHVYSPQITNSRAEVLYGKLWEQGSEGIQKYEHIHNIEPLNRALNDLKVNAWITGLHQKHPNPHSHIPVALLEENITKIRPIAEWTDKDVTQFLKEKGLPYHPLWEKGYTYVGDWHSTSPPQRSEKNPAKNDISYVIDFQI